MNPIADADSGAPRRMGETADSAAARERAIPISVAALWILGAASFAAIILLFTPFTYQLDDIKVTLQFVLAPIIGGLAAIALLCRHTTPIHPWIGLPLLAYILLGLLSTLLGEYRWITWQEFGFELALIVAFISVALTATTIGRFKNFCRFYFAVGCVTVVFGLFHYFGGISWVFYRLYPNGNPSPSGPSPLFALLMTLDRNRQMLSTILNRDFYPAYLVMIAPLAAAFFLDARRRVERAFCAVAGLLYCLSIVLAQSNDGNIALTVMFVLFAALLVRGRHLAGIPRQVLRVWIAGGAILVLTTLFFMRSYFLAIPNQAPFAFRSRAIIWSGALGIFFDPSQPAAVFLKQMILGCGPGEFMILLPRYQSPDFYRWAIAPITQFSHSQPLDLLSERGVLGTLAFACFLAGIVRLLFREIRRRPDNPLVLYQIALLTAIVGITLQNLTSPNIRWTACGFNYWFLLGLSAAAVRLGLPKEERVALERAWNLPPPLRGFAAVALLAAMLIFEIVSVPFGICRFISSKYNNDGRIKVNDMGALINQLAVVPAGAKHETLRRQALDYTRAAEADLERSIQWLPSFVSSYYLLGHVFTRHAALEVDSTEIARARQRAIEAYDRLASYAPDYAEIHVGYGLVYQHAYSDTKQPSDKEQALRHLEEAARSTAELQTQMLYANGLMTMGEPERAKSAYWRILDLARKCMDKEKSAIVGQVFAELLAEARRVNDAKQIVTLCRRQLEEQPQDAAAFVELTENLRRLGRDFEVLELCRDRIAQDPLDPLARNVAAKILFEHGAYQKAWTQVAAMQRIQDHRQSAAAGPGSSSPAGRTAELRDPRREELWFQAGQIAERLNNTSEALSCYQKSMGLARDSRMAWRAREAYESLRARQLAPPKR